MLKLGAKSLNIESSLDEVMSNIVTKIKEKDALK